MRMKLPFILSIPHCGNQIPSELRPSIALSESEIAEAEDYGTREIFADLPAVGIIAARWSRLVVDLNRSPDQYDPKGVVALTDYLGRTVFKPGCEPTLLEIQKRVAQFHQPYHDQLTAMLRGEPFAGLIDCHSLNGKGPADAPDSGRPRKDVILSNNGDHRGRQRSTADPLSCSAGTLQAAADAFVAQGFSVALNTPYRGGHITIHYGRQLRDAGRFAMQIEMNQDLYMAPGTLQCDRHRLHLTTERVKQALAAWAGQMKLTADCYTS
jgi:N-formylglutamate deformylase